MTMTKGWRRLSSLCLLPAGSSVGREARDSCFALSFCYVCVVGAQIIMDGTLTWDPYVRQTIDMVRSIHRHHYCMGPGYR